MQLERGLRVEQYATPYAHDAVLDHVRVCIDYPSHTLPPLAGWMVGSYQKASWHVNIVNIFTIERWFVHLGAGFARRSLVNVSASGSRHHRFTAKTRWLPVDLLTADRPHAICSPWDTQRVLIGGLVACGSPADR